MLEENRYIVSPEITHPFSEMLIEKKYLVLSLCSIFSAELIGHFDVI